MAAEFFTNKFYSVIPFLYAIGQSEISVKEHGECKRH